MKNTLISLAGAATIAAASLGVPSTAHAGDGGAIAAGIIGGLAAGAIIGGAAAHGPYYAPAPVYYGAYGPGPGCEIRRERVWDGYGWRVQRVRVCY